MKILKVSRCTFLKSIFALAFVFLASSLQAQPPAGILNTDHPGVRAVMMAQAEVTSNWMKHDGVLGTAVGLSDRDELVLVVYVDQDHQAVDDVIRSLPAKVRGVGVKVQLTDKFRSMARTTGGTTAVSHKAKQSTPIELGTSGGWTYDLANGYCCGGTLGALVKVNTTRYILSNYHVLESDIVSGGNSRSCATGDGVIQPGLIDVSCSSSSAQTVGTLVKLSALPNNNVDCAVAQVSAGMVSTNGSILEIGVISSQTVGASLSQKVKKSGRTTGLSRSSVSGLNATISVSYENECAGGNAFTRTFTGQIVIANTGSKFLNSGDSGSLMVEDVATSPRAIGLLYAGGKTDAIANPIGDVLSFLSSKLGGTATMVGN